MLLAASLRRSVRWHGTGSTCLAAAIGLLPSMAAPQPGSVEEIVVTARKIEEDLYRVPMSVQALPGTLIDETDPSDLYELQFEIPGLVVTSSGMFGAGIALRGVTDEGGANLAVSPHLDGVPLGDSMLALARLFDVERIEVLKGPQGTLYGRNSTGGSINVITRGPTDELGAGIEAAVGSFDTRRARGFINVPGRNIAFRIAAAASAGDGFIRNSIDERKFAEQDYTAVRASVRATPTDALTIDLSAQRVEDDGATGDVWLPRKDYLVDPGDIRLTTVTLEDPHLWITDDFVDAHVAYDFETVTLRSISGYAHNFTDGRDDCAGLPQLQDCVRGVDPSTFEQWSQELQLVSKPRGRIEWLTGLFLFRSDGATHYYLTAPLISPGPINDSSSTSHREARAVFGNARYRIDERWSLDGGVRISDELSRVAGSGTGGADNPLFRVAEDSWSHTSWRASLEYAPADGALLYGSVATGFRSGGITTNVLPDGQFDGYEPEVLTAYELGVKLRRRGLRWSMLGSVFLYDFEDLQVGTRAFVGDRFVTVIDNAAAAEIYGLDVSGAFQAAQRMTLSAGVVWLPKRGFTDFTTAATGTSYTDNQLSRAPEWTATAAVEYRRSFGKLGELSARLDYDYRSAFFFTKENEPAASQEAFSLLNLYVQLRPPGDSWYVMFSGRNLLDTDYFNQIFIQSSPGYPANYELGFGLNF